MTGSHASHQAPPDSLSGAEPEEAGLEFVLKEEKQTGHDWSHHSLVFQENLWKP